MKRAFTVALLTSWLVLNGYGFENYPPFSLQNLFQTGNTFTSKEGRFSLTLPTGFNKLKYSSSITSTDSGNITLHEYSQELDRGTCFISFYDFPESLFQRKTISQMLEDGRDRAIKNMKATLKKEEWIKVDGHQGKTLLLEVPHNNKVLYVRLDFFITKPRAYTYIYLSYNQAELNKTDVKKYFESFHVLK